MACLSFEYCMAQEAYCRRCEYTVTDHAEKAFWHARRWYWMDRAVKLVLDGPCRQAPGVAAMKKAMLRDNEGKPFEGELVRRVELPGLHDYQLALTVPNEGVFTVTELETGMALGCGTSEQCALDDARRELVRRGPVAFARQISKRLVEFGPLPPVGGAQ